MVRAGGHSFDLRAIFPGDRSPAQAGAEDDPADNRVYFIEANPNPILAADEDFALSALQSGLAYPQLIECILRHALSAGECFHFTPRTSKPSASSTARTLAA